jgi:hypothetical protein
MGTTTKDGATTYQPQEKSSERARDETAGRGRRQYCTGPVMPERILSPDVSPMRARAILESQYKWVNGTVIHYYFFDKETDGEEVRFPNGRSEWRTWRGAPDQVEVVREAFNRWKGHGIGLEFREVDDRDEAELRIGFMPDDGAWSFIGTYALEIGAAERTMNFGWSLTGSADGFDTALHEIGHALGMPHEHQNPNSGIEWDEEAVYAALAAPPNRWSRTTTYNNIIRKLPGNSIQGSMWDPDSIMHYPFEAGLIKKPEPYRNGLTPRGGLSPRDIAWARSFYPATGDAALPELVPGRSEPLAVRNGEQQDFEIRPSATRTYNLQTFGSCDTTAVLFVERDGELRYVAGDDDSGEERNASLRTRLTRNRRYVLRVRLKYSDNTSPPSVMLW